MYTHTYMHLQLMHLQLMLTDLLHCTHPTLHNPLPFAHTTHTHTPQYTHVHAHTHTRTHSQSKDIKLQRVALESLYRLLWVYVVRVKCTDNVRTQRFVLSVHTQHVLLADTILPTLVVVVGPDHHSAVF